jgi:S-(hydroxymethyl)glutathione dehydrogenase/alcohol dehydrogenase
MDMAIKARIVVLPPGRTTLEIQEVTLPSPRAFEVVVEQRATGVCHSQLDHIAHADPTQPLILGHESFGVVVAAGGDVEHVKPGDEVFVTWLPRVTSRSPHRSQIPLADGGLAVSKNVFTWGTHCLVDEQYVVKADPEPPPDIGSIIGCAVMTGAGAVVNTAHVQAGDSVAVWGVGGVGLVAVAAARALGAAPVIAIDIDQTKLLLAERMGADHVVDVSQTDAVEAVRQVTVHVDGSRGVDHSIDCTGLAGNLRSSLAAARQGVPGGRSGGAAVLVGAIRDTVEFTGLDLLHGQKRIIGCLGGGSVPDRDFATFVDWYRKDLLILDPLITNRYELDDINRAVDDLRHGRVVGRAVIEL